MIKVPSEEVPSEEVPIYTDDFIAYNEYTPYGQANYKKIIEKYKAIRKTVYSTENLTNDLLDRSKYAENSKVKVGHFDDSNYKSIDPQNPNPDNINKDRSFTNMFASQIKVHNTKDQRHQPTKEFCVARHVADVPRRGTPQNVGTHTNTSGGKR